MTLLIHIYLYLSISKARLLLEDKNISAMILPSKSNMIEKFTSQGKSKGIVERYRIIIPTKQSLRDNTDLETYREFQRLVSIEIGVDTYVDRQALNDMARFYYHSPSNATPIIVKAKKVIDISSIELEAIENIKKAKELKEIALIERKNRQNRKIRKKSTKSHSNYLTYVDDDMILDISISTLIYNYENVIKDWEEGTYHYIKTDMSTYSIIDNMVYDFKSSETYNILTYLKKQLQTDNLNTIALELQSITGEEYIKIDYEVVKLAIDSVLVVATNDKTFESGIKEYFGCRYCKLAKDSVQIAGKSIKLVDVGWDKGGVVRRLVKNRRRL
jgi:hypothetical protein